MSVQADISVSAESSPNTRQLGDTATRELAAAISGHFVEAIAVSSAAHAVGVASVLRGSAGRVVVKLISDVVVHKSEHGLVRLNVAVEQAGSVYDELMSIAGGLGAEDATVVVQPMVEDGLDLIVGMDRDPTFGPLLVLGLGGVTVEVFRDVTHAVAPVTPDAVLQLLRTLDSYPLLTGFRGATNYDLTHFAKLVSDVGELVIRDGSIAELDLNPVRLYPDGRCVILDSRAAVYSDPRPKSAPPRPPKDIRALLRPRSVAVLGASRDESRPGGRVVRGLVDKGFSGDIWPINQNAAEVGGVPTFPSLQALPGIPDVVCIALPAEAAIGAVADCVDASVPAVVVLASGFAEIGKVGQDRERELANVLAGTATVMCGPNTIGVVSAAHKLSLTFSQGLANFTLTDNGVSVIAQSGAVAGSLISRELVRGYGIGDWVTVGSQISIDVADYLEFLVAQPETRAVALFLEGVDDGARFMRALGSARAAGIPVVVFKTGVSESGSRAVMSHAGALAGSAKAYSAALRQNGAVQVNEVTALLEVAWVLGNYKQPRGRRMAVVSTSGGAGSTVTDLIDLRQLELADLAADTIEYLNDLLPEFAHAANPLDVTAEGAFSPSVIYESLRALCEDDAVDFVGVLLTSLADEHAVRAARQVADAASKTDKPILVCWLIASELAAEGMRILAEAGIRVFDEPTRMVDAARHLVDRGAYGDEWDE